jgi:hypothetical protein
LGGYFTSVPSEPYSINSFVALPAGIARALPPFKSTETELTVSKGAAEASLVQFSEQYINLTYI